MHQNLILCSTGTFIHGWNGRDHTLIKKMKPRLLYRGFEIMMYNHYAGVPAEYEAVARAIVSAKDNGALFYSMHMSKQIGELISRNENDDIEAAVRMFESNCAYAVRYGVKLLVLHLWGGIPSDRHIDVNIRVYPRLKEIADRHHLLLTVENIVCNTHRPLDHMRSLWETYGEDIRFTIDVRQAEFHKSLVDTCESDFLWENNLVPHLHFSDYSGGCMDWSRLGVHTPLGEGDVDFAYFFSFLRSIGFQGSMTVECGFGQETSFEDMVCGLNRSYTFIAEHQNQVG